MSSSAMESSLPSVSSKSLPSSIVRPLPPQPSRPLPATRSSLPRVLHGSKAQPCPARENRPYLGAGARFRACHEPALVEKFRRERADIWMEAASLRQENALVVSDGRTPVQQVTERRDVCARADARPSAAGRVAADRQAARRYRRWRGSESVRERHLTRLVHEQHVHGVCHLPACPQPRRSCGDLCGAFRQGIQHLLRCSPPL